MFPSIQNQTAPEPGALMLLKPPDIPSASLLSPPSPTISAFPLALSSTSVPNVR